MTQSERDATTLKSYKCDELDMLRKLMGMTISSDPSMVD
jgi:hypothetical protein